jgi:hypothetical protein
MSKNKPRVGMIYSENAHHSLESKNLAHYLCGLLVNSGWSIVYMVPFAKDGPVAEIQNKRISFIPPNESRPIELPVSF